MTENTNTPSTFDIENSLATLIRELSETVSAMRGDDRDIEHRRKLHCLAENAAEELEMWGRAVGHTSWLASTHQEADKSTTDSLGLISLMQGRFLTLTNSLDELKWELTHKYDRKENKMLIDDVSSC